jgi:peroxiredoxin
MSSNIAQLAQFTFIGAAALGVYMFVTTAQDGEARASCTALCALHPAYANTNRTVPDFELPDLQGRPVRISNFQGKTVVLNFWTKTCKPCLEEMPALADLARTFQSEGSDIQVVTITTDESADDARMTLQAILGSEPPFPVLIDPGGDKVVNGRFGTHLFPETWFIDPRGVIRVRVDGARDWSNSMAVEVAKMVSRPSGCGISFESSKPRGPRSELCASGDE